MNICRFEGCWANAGDLFFWHKSSAVFVKTFNIKSNKLCKNGSALRVRAQQGGHSRWSASLLGPATETDLLLCSNTPSSFTDLRLERSQMSLLKNNAALTQQAAPTIGWFFTYRCWRTHPYQACSQVWTGILNSISEEPSINLWPMLLWIHAKGTSLQLVFISAERSSLGVSTFVWLSILLPLMNGVAWETGWLSRH